MIDTMTLLAVHADDIATGAGGLSAGVLAMLAIQAVAKKRGNNGRGLTEAEHDAIINTAKDTAGMRLELHELNQYLRERGR